MFMVYALTVFSVALNRPVAFLRKAILFQVNDLLSELHFGICPGAVGREINVTAS